MKKIYFTLLIILSVFMFKNSAYAFSYKGNINSYINILEREKSELEHKPGSDNPNNQGSQNREKSDLEHKPGYDNPVNQGAQDQYDDEVFSFCDQEGVLKALKVLSVLIMIAKIAVPIILIVVGSIDYGKAMMSDNQDAIEKTTQSLIKKVIVGLIIFLVPTIVNAVISSSQSAQDKADASGEFIKCAMCFAGDSSCDGYIDSADK